MKEYQDFISRAITLIIMALFHTVVVLIVGNCIGVIGLIVLFACYFATTMGNILDDTAYAVLNLIFLIWTFCWIVTNIS